MKYIGIDYGTKKTGIAISDPLGTMAFPRDVLLTDKFLPSIVADLIAEEEVEAVVIGESRDLHGGFNRLVINVRNFVEQLKEFAGQDLKVHYEDERFTTKQARALPNEGMARGNVANMRGKRINAVKADAQAAAIILQSFLDKQKNLG